MFESWILKPLGIITLDFCNYKKIINKLIYDQLKSKYDFFIYLIIY